jgi:predicted metal-dependent HD superfamily phosphohydrolase
MIKLFRIAFLYLLFIISFSVFNEVIGQSLSLTKNSEKISSGYKNDFIKIIALHSNETIANEFWKEVDSLYSGTDRHYHTLSHLQNFYTQLLKCKSSIKDWESMIIAMVYHDIIYNSTDHKDEEKSAELAVKRLHEISLSESKIINIMSLVLATKAHALSADNDTNIFNDADMSILGLDRVTYGNYVKNVRLEYINSPNFDIGRKKVLNYFLQMEYIYKTTLFRSLYEDSARKNIEWEIKTIH